MSTRSPMGAIVYETGGILVDKGWIRILGSGCAKMKRGLMDWNKGKSFTEYGQGMSFLLVADDVLGGFFAINNGGLDTANRGAVYYFAPDTQEWEFVSANYTAFLQFCFCGDLQTYYGAYRWTGWEEELKKMNADTAMYFFPYLWTAEGQKDINQITRKPVPLEELWKGRLILNGKK